MSTLREGLYLEPGLDRVSDSGDASISAVSWAAILAGALVIAAVSLILLALGSGFGLASVSPWAGAGVSVTTFTALTAVWLVVVQWVAAALGGYLTGRLRVRWVGTHTHEVFFRDTAHGFLTWAVATIVSAGLLASAASSILGGGLHAGTTVAAAGVQGAAREGVADIRAYDVDSLFRSGQQSGNSPAAETNAEASRILAAAWASGDMPAADRTYLAQLVATRTGLSQPDAEKRVDDVIAQEKAAKVKLQQAADAARKATAAFSIYTAVSMLIGAFIAAIAAALGGQQRDEHP